MRPPQTSAGPPGVIAATAFIAGLFLFGIATYEWLAAQRLRAEALLADGNYSSDFKTLRALQQSVQAADRSAAKLQQTSDDLAATGFGGGGGRRSNLEQAKAAGQAFLAAVPQAHDLLVSIGEAQLDMAWAPFFKAANLTAAQIDQLHQVTMDTWLASLAVEPTGGIHPTTTQPTDDQLQAILGDEGLQQYKDYTRTLPVQNMALQIASAAGSAGAPMSSDQSLQLAQAMAATSDAYQKGTSATLNTVDWDSSLAQAQKILTPQQYQAALPLIANRQYISALQQAMQSQNVIVGGQESPR